MNPFRATTSDKDLLTALAERLILSMASAQVDLPAVRPEALWALAIAVGGWYPFTDGPLLSPNVGVHVFSVVNDPKNRVVDN